MNGIGRRFIIFFVTLTAVAFLSLWVPFCKKAPATFVNTIALDEGWHIQASEWCKKKGETISTPGFNPQGWHEASVPTTVLAALVKKNIYRDIYFARNLENIPVEQFKQPWWYRKEFNLDGQSTFSAARLKFEGINYSADIWLNGVLVSDRNNTKGAFRIFTMDVTKLLKPGRNVLAVQVFPPEPGDFTIGFVDWNPTPPDKNMGLWREVKLLLSGRVSLNDTFVQSKVKTDTLDEASLTITAHLENHGDGEVSGTLKGKIEDITFSQPYSLKPLEKKNFTFNPGEFKELVFKNPRLWWPNNLGEPHLYELEMTALVNDEISDRQEVTFGIREVSDYINKEGHRGYKVNGREVLIRGGGWVDDLLLADDDAKIEAQMKYVKHMNLNTVRLEGFWGSSHKLYDLADRYGILLMAGWSCQWEWEDYLGKPVDEFGGIKTPEEMNLVAASLRDQVVWLRNHPSIFVWVLGSDALPRPQLERKYNAHLAEVDPTRPVLASCKYKVSEISGPSAVKMAGPYDYVPPVYWYVNKKQGGAFGFNTETGPGPQPPPLESIERMLPKENLWPMDKMWEFHCGRNEFNTMNRYAAALDGRYGKSDSVVEFAWKAQAANYEAMRAMFEAFGVNKPNTTGIIQWMLNSAWPEMYWQLYDYYLMPNGAFYGAKTGSQPLNIVYNYGDKAIYVVNDTYSSHELLKAEIRVFSFDSKELFSKTLPVTVGEYESKKILDFPDIKGLTGLYFIGLKLRGHDGSVRGDNFYWLSTKEDTLDEAGTTWYYTPIKDFADLTALEMLPKAAVDVQHRFETVEGEQVVYVTLNNESDKIAFFIELRVVDETSGLSILPIFWSDNYVSLLPGETRKITGRFSGGEKPAFGFSGWNSH
jgi:exo-1,4-beta-D-glucosaminidase